MTINGFNDLFAAKKQNDNIIELDTLELNSFANHPFKVNDSDSSMYELIESIKTKGILNPLIVRECDNGYEIISGHRRKRAAELAGIKTVPAIVKHLSDDDAVIEMVDSNIYRPTILPSEKAFSYKLKQEALKHQGKRGSNTNEEVGKEFGDSVRQVQRYIRLTNLIPELLQLIDDEPKKRLMVGVNLSNLDKNEQLSLYQYLDDEEKFPTIKQSEAIAAASKTNHPITYSVIESIMVGSKKVKPKKTKIIFDVEFTNKYFNGMSDDEITEIVKEIVQGYYKK